MTDALREWEIACRVAKLAPFTGNVPVHSSAIIAIDAEITRLRAAISAPPAVPPGMADAEEWLHSRFGVVRGHPEWRALVEAFDAGKAAASQPPAAQPATDRESLTVAAQPESAQPVPATRAQPWQPIETAPDELYFTALVASLMEGGKPYVEEAWWDHERREWWPANTEHGDPNGSALHPTHWMPLPAPPLAAAHTGSEAE